MCMEKSSAILTHAGQATWHCLSTWRQTMRITPGAATSRQAPAAIQLCTSFALHSTLAFRPFCPRGKLFVFSQLGCQVQEVSLLPVTAALHVNVLLLLMQALQRRFSAEEHRDAEFQRTLERNPSELSSWSDGMDSTMEDVTGQSGVLIQEQAGSPTADSQETWQRNSDTAGEQDACSRVMHDDWHLVSIQIVWIMLSPQCQ